MCPSHVAKGVAVSTDRYRFAAGVGTSVMKITSALGIPTRFDPIEEMQNWTAQAATWARSFGIRIQCVVYGWEVGKSSFYRFLSSEDKNSAEIRQKDCTETMKSRSE